MATGTNGWVTDPADLVGSMNEGDTDNSNTVYYKQIDAAGNESGVSSYSFAYDATAPAITSITAAGDGAFTVDDSIDFTVTLSETVLADGALRLTLNTGETVTVTTSEAGDTLTGTYTVTGTATDAADLEVTAVELGSDTDTDSPTDTAGNAMVAVTVESGDYVFTSIEIDTTAPSNLSGMDLSNDTGVSAIDDLAANTDLDTTAAGEGLDTGGNVETSTITYFAMTDAGAGTSGWETSTSTPESSMVPARLVHRTRSTTSRSTPRVTSPVSAATH